MKLYPIDHRADGKPGRWVFHCPVCDTWHWVDDRWEIDWETQTITPSIYAAAPLYCHVAVQGGQLVYGRDSGHRLAGQTIPMSDEVW